MGRIRVVFLIFSVCVVSLVIPSGSAAERFWQLSLSGGVTNHWFENDIDDRIHSAELTGGIGWTLKPHLELLLTADLHNYRIEAFGDARSFGLTPRIRWRRPRIYAEFGLGVMVNDIPLEAFKNTLKWSPQTRLAWRLNHSGSMDWWMISTFSHYSHSMLSQRRNVGINTHSFGLAVTFGR
jgi:hypothetical protein